MAQSACHRGDADRQHPWNEGPSMNESVLCEAYGGVLVITINRPEARNAINNSVADSLMDAAERLDADDEFSVGVLTGSGAGFCAGLDLKAFVTEGLPRALGPFYARVSAKPMVAAVEGFALAGGLEAALTCDLIVASKGAMLGIPEVTRGLLAAGGGVIRLGRRLPYSVAMEMALTGDPITAEQAYAFGLVSRLTEPGAALPTAVKLAERIARNAPLSVRASKALVRDSVTISDADHWQYQEPLVRQVLKSADAKEGARAFAEKRAPLWTGA
jgi:enoyl-CoA hydratase